jgi:cytochrome c-type biogenesis protein CcmH/NrfF
VVQYGERVLAEPKRSGFTAFVWLLPVIALVLGAAVLVQVGRSWLAGRLAQPVGQVVATPNAPDIPPDVLARLEKELREIA